MTEILIILALILLNGVFAMAEIALVSARKARLEAQANKGDLRAREALELANHPDKFISTTQIGITLIGILNGLFSGESLKSDLQAYLNNYPSLQGYSGGIATTIIVIAITYFSLVLGELVPKRIGLSNPEGIAKTLAAPMRIVTLITYPFIWLLTKSGNLLVRLFKIKNRDNQVTEEEIKAIINEGTEHGAIDEAEQEIIERVFHLGDRNITSLMTHRSDMVWIEYGCTVGDIKKLNDELVHSVYPVCEGSIDNIKGVVSLKDVFKLSSDIPVSEVMRAALYVPENNSAYQLLEKFKVSRTHYAFIVDEYGSMQGIITLNDILSAIVGDFSEPHEEDYEITARGNGSFLFDAQLPWYRFLSYFKKAAWSEGDEDFDTLAGFILQQLERIPSTGDKVVWRGFEFEIVDMDAHRIDKLLITVSDEILKDMQEE